MILYEGPSAINGDPIAVIATGYTKPTANPKTGPMVQLWFLPTKSHPLDAQQNGDDVAVCGSCPLRKSVAEPGGVFCYVRGHPLLSVTRAYRAGKYVQGDLPTLLELTPPRLPLRLGAYGEPTAVPFTFWGPLVTSGRPWTGYTHRWRGIPADPWASLLMASVESPADLVLAQALGWRTFRVRQLSEADDGTVLVDRPLANEVICPASDEAGYRKHCATCRLCDGKHTGDRRKSVAIIDHGTRRALRLRAKALGKAPTQLKFSALNAAGGV